MATQGTAPFPNLYSHRKVAESAARSCYVCSKFTTSVLITPAKEDFFYVCAVHLKDRKFCLPIIDEAQKKEKADKEMREEVERVKKEYEEKQKKKKEKDKKKDGDGDEKAKAGKDAEDKGSDAKKDEGDAASEPPPEEEPRVFELGKVNRILCRGHCRTKRLFFQNRIDRKRDAEALKRQAEQSRQNQERMRNPDFFPSVPKDVPRSG